MGWGVRGCDFKLDFQMEVCLSNSEKINLDIQGSIFLLINFGASFIEKKGTLEMKVSTGFHERV